MISFASSGLDHVLPLDDVGSQDVLPNLLDVFDHLDLGPGLATADHDLLNTLGGGEELKVEPPDAHVLGGPFEESLEGAQGGRPGSEPVDVFNLVLIEFIG